MGLISRVSSRTYRYTLPVIDKKMSALPDGWSEKMSQSHGVPYFVNNITNTAQWERPTVPAGAMSKKVQVLHLLVKHNKSRNPKSWKSPNGITISKDQAIQQLAQFRQQIENSVDQKKAFEMLASQESDCSSAKRGGDLGMFGRNQMQKPFEEASFNLKPGQLSQIVDTDSGVHIIFRLQ